MSDILELIRKRIYARDHIPCPHCAGEIDMTDSERLMGHVTYWGDTGPVEDTCPKCGKPVFIEERIERSWVAGKTADEAGDL